MPLSSSDDRQNIPSSAMTLPDGTDFSFDFCPPSPSKMCAADSIFHRGRLLPLGALPPRSQCPLPAGSEQTQQAYGHGRTEIDLEGIRSRPKYRRLKSVPEESDTVPRTPRPRLSWYVMFFGSVRAPEAMEMKDIRSRLMKDIRSRQRRRSGVPAPSGCGGEKVGSKGPWKLLRSLSCTGVETVAAAVPLSFM